MNKFRKDAHALNARKQKVITVGEGYPARSTGHEGEVVVRRLRGKGLHLFVKHGQRWY